MLTAPLIPCISVTSHLCTRSGQINQCSMSLTVKQYKKLTGSSSSLFLAFWVFFNVSVRWPAFHIPKALYLKHLYVKMKLNQYKQEAFGLKNTKSQLATRSWEKVRHNKCKIKQSNVFSYITVRLFRFKQ